MRSGLSFSTMRIESRFSLHSSDQCSSSCSVIGRLQPNAISSLMTSSPLYDWYGNTLLQPTVSASASLQSPVSACS